MMGAVFAMQKRCDLAGFEQEAAIDRDVRGRLS
jgi:hypothetical protein